MCKSEPPTGQPRPKPSCPIWSVRGESRLSKRLHKSEEPSSVDPSPDPGVPWGPLSQGPRGVPLGRIGPSGGPTSQDLHPSSADPSPGLALCKVCPIGTVGTGRPVGDSSPGQGTPRPTHCMRSEPGSQPSVGPLRIQSSRRPYPRSPPRCIPAPRRLRGQGHNFLVGAEPAAQSAPERSAQQGEASARDSARARAPQAPPHG